MKIRELFDGKVCTFSNFLSVMRVLLIPVLFYTLYLEEKSGIILYRYYTVSIFTFIVLSDYLDGLIARKLNQVSRLGQFLDPLADKIVFISSGILLIIFRDFPIWLVIIIFIREIIIIICSLMIFSRRNIQVRPNIMGKLMAVSMGVAGYIYILSPEYKIAGISLHLISVVLIVIFITLSVIIAWRKYYKAYYS